MTDEQHDHDPEASAEPHGGQASGADQENEEQEPLRRPHHTIRDVSEEIEKAIGKPLLDEAAMEAKLRQAMEDPVRRVALSRGLTTLAAALEQFIPIRENTVRSAVQASLAMQSALSNLDLRNLMPGGALSRNEAFRLAGSTLWERLQELDPENWREEQLRRLDMLSIMEEGIPLVWTPSADVIRDLLDAPDAPARRKVLEQKAAAVVEHCRTVLSSVVRNDLAAEADFLNDCLDLIGSGKHAAAQVLASSVLDTVLRAMVRADPRLQGKKGQFHFKSLAAQLPKASSDTQVGRFRAYCINSSIHKAYEQYYGPPVPEEYNRHATAHAAGPTQITLANALAAVMLAVGMVRELEETQRPLIPAG
ncbi:MULTISPECIES: hypothetical protein [unclassified Streptomyces]|uniref:hypothetical protein n=1 Tax=unclassified Streptomyces TaxID=2593676 RepID=UPI001FD044EE|nr:MULTISPECIES: hypothetical protein [unclassified Streptomyces]MDH3033993.1 hypothetical protein [Streptomyces sp. TRM75561]